MMREIMISSDCLDFIERQDKRVSLKFFQIIEVMTEVKVVHSTFVKKLINTSFYELRIKSGNEIRIILFTVDHPNFIESSKIICLNGFVKKSNNDYKKAIKIAEKLIKNYL